ncbi:uncharacterized protein LOC107041059 isoform X2 [Diachasma alloeum]|uniref:uncharacterized protein LOC107041059 isoform X2 n=1 Tax=Diachasma alloeum TaxID=454923 RepID=UPI0007381D0C|nr:uncharacterized protein LOC107041059 isoform X2 [Diachasma alloeum]
MSPGVNDGPRKTGTLPKSNRRNDRNRDVANATRQVGRTAYDRRLHPNNLLDWQPVSDREPGRTTKNSNARSTSSVPSTSYQDLADIASYHRQYNYTGEDYIPWQEMAQPMDSRAQSPPSLQNSKPTNVDKMPDRRQVESRLNQIRDYIRVTSTMMDSLNQSSDPRARAQHDKLAKMVEDLCDSETKLAKLLEDYRGLPDEIDREDGEEPLEAKLRKKMEASQRKLAQLQEHQANLVGMQLRVRERLNEARQAQQLLLLQENEQANAAIPLPYDNGNRSQQQLVNDADALESETIALRGKLTQLQNKKKQMDTLVSELQAAELSDRASCSSENSKHTERDKVAELEVLKAQLAHLKGLMEEATRVRDAFNSTSETDAEAINGCCENGEVEEDGDVAASFNSFDRNSETDESPGKFNNSKEQLTVEQIQAVTRELKEQQVLLQSARAELQRLKNPSSFPPVPAPMLFLPGTTSPSSFAAFTPSDKKQSNNNNNNHNNNNNAHVDVPQAPGGHENQGQASQATRAQNKKRQLEELVRKDQSQSSSVNRDVGAAGWGSRRGSNSHRSHTSTPANIWPGPSAIVGSSNEPSVDGISTTDNLLDIGPHVPAIENGFPPSWWNMSAPPVSQPQGPAHSTEYYRQLLMSSQAQQLQMMSTTMQQCCQLLWAQQRELQSMRSAITQLQQQFRQAQAPGVNENREDYSNLSRSIHHLENTLDSTLPPSSSLPNLVSLPTTSQTPAHPPIIASANSHQHHNHQQLNNQVPPGNRANNYWDNFRSYSRQNLLSGTPKTLSDSMPGPSSNTNTTTNTTASGLHISHLRDKRNREHAADNLSLPSLTGSDAQYSLNLQMQSNIQSHEREIPASRTNILSNEAAQMQQVENFWEDAHSSFRLVPESNEDIYSLRHLNAEMRDVLVSLVAANKRRPDYLVIILREIKAISEDQRLRPRLLRSLRALQDMQTSSNPLNEVPDQTASESCQSSDDDSDVGARGGSLMNSNVESQSLLTEMFLPMHSSMQVPQSIAAPFPENFDFEGAMQLETINALPSMSSISAGYNEDLAEADQSRPDASNDQQNSFDEGSDEGEDNEPLSHMAPVQGAAAVELDREQFPGQDPNDQEAFGDSPILDRIPTRLLHH